MRTATAMALAILAAIVAVGCSGASEADKYPTRQMSYLIPFDPGGQSDVEARLQQPLLERALGQKVNIEYKPGGGGAVGWAEMVRGKPDGYQITNVILPAIVQLPMTQDSGFKTDQILSVAMYHRAPTLMLVREDNPFKDVKDLIAAAKKDPGKLKFGTTGRTAFSNLQAMRLAQMTGITYEMVPFTGTAPMMTALLGGHIDVAVSMLNDGVAFKGQARGVAVASEKRSESAPEIPTFKEQGIDLVAATIRGIGVPAGTPDSISRKLEKVMLEVLKNPEYIKAQIKTGFEPAAMGIEDAKAETKKQADEAIPLLKELGVYKQ